MKNLPLPVLLIVYTPLGPLFQIIFNQQGLHVGVVIEGLYFLLGLSLGTRLDMISLRIRPRHMLVACMSLVPPLHLGFNKNNIFRPGTAQEGQGGAVFGPVLGLHHMLDSASELVI